MPFKGKNESAKWIFKVSSYTRLQSLGACWWKRVEKNEMSDSLERWSLLLAAFVMFPPLWIYALLFPIYLAAIFFFFLFLLLFPNLIPRNISKIIQAASSGIQSISRLEPLATSLTLWICSSLLAASLARRGTINLNGWVLIKLTAKVRPEAPNFRGTKFVRLNGRRSIFLHSSDLSRLVNGDYVTTLTVIT